MGDLPQSKRLKIVDAVKKGKHKFLVATDVAARGLHIDELEMVINYDVPLEAESYVHRIGRTARAGREGKTVTLACEEYVYGLGPIEKLLGEKIPVSWADEKLIEVEDKSEGMRFPHQQRYRELDTRKNRNASSRKNNSRDSRSRQQVRGRRPLEERAAKVQSAVSNVVSGESFEPENKNKPGGNRHAGQKTADKKQTGKSSKNRKTGKETPLETAASKAPSRNRSRSGRPQDKKDRKNWSESPERQNKPSNKGFDGERVTASNSEEERLAYYRKKYGEDFQFSEGAASASGSAGKKPSRKKGFFKRLLKK